ncbi:MAG: M24 family metallopeptidase [Polaromonas sp.]
MKHRFAAEVDAQYRSRHEALLNRPRRCGLQQLVVTATDSIYYLTDATCEPLERPFFLVIDAATRSRRLLVPLLEQRHMLKGWGADEASIQAYREFPAPAGEGWADALGDMVRSEFAFEPGTPYEVAQKLSSLGGRPMDLLEGMRIIKSPWEIRQIERAAEYADWGVQQILRASYYGATVAEGYTAANALLRKIVKQEPEFDALATKVIAAPWPAPLSSDPHSVPKVDMLLREGPHVAMVLTRVNGYAAESERTFFTAPPSGSEQSMFSLMEEARKLAFGLVRPGVACAEIDASVNAYLGKEGFADCQTRLHRVGHGFGLGNHEPPWIAEGSGHVLATNMVISIEPGLYQQGLGGYRHSDTVLATADGYRTLTKAPRELQQLVLGKASMGQRLKGFAVKSALGMGRAREHKC